MKKIHICVHAYNMHSITSSRSTIRICRKSDQSLVNLAIFCCILQIHVRETTELSSACQHVQNAQIATFIGEDEASDPVTREVLMLLPDCLP